MFKNTLKRLGAIVLALAMAMSVMMVSAFAVEQEPEQEPEQGGGTTQSVTLFESGFTKTYTMSTGAVTAPSEALELEQTSKAVTNNSAVKYNTKENIPNVTVTKAADSSNFVFTANAAYEGVGVFTYTFTEKNAGTAGVTYSGATVTLHVIRTWGGDVGDATNISQTYEFGIISSDGTEKTESITNEFNAGSLTISKKLAGTMADPADEFEVTVTFTSEKPVLSPIYKDGTASENVVNLTWVKNEENGTYTASTTATISVNKSVTFNNIPAGVQYSVVETDTADYVEGDPVYSDQTKTISKNDSDTVKITNTKNGSPVTGVIMNIAPYVLMVALAGGIAFFFLRRRNAE